VSHQEKVAVQLVQQGVWDMQLESMPLAAGYLKAMALADDRVRRRMAIGIANFRGSASLATMANDLFSSATPDVLAFSVLG
jgi:hypothetical protein